MRCTRIGEEPDQKNADNNTDYYGTPKYVVDVLGRAVSKTHRRLPERAEITDTDTEIKRRKKKCAHKTPQDIIDGEGAGG